MDNGYWNKALRVDLTSRTVTVETIDDEVFKKFIGGAGIAAKILLEETAAKLDPLGAENKVIFACGPFQGPVIPGGAKWTIAAKSPLTGTWADSAAGADFGPALKGAGYDLLIIEGKSEKPVYVKVINDKVEICDAAGVWGLDAYETCDAIWEREANKKLSIAAIGPAGEKQVAFACVVVDQHSFAGRGGIGAVMGSKNLKAVAAQGTKTLPLHDAQAVKKRAAAASKKIVAAVKENEFRKHGTPALCAYAEEIGDMPIKNWMGEVWKGGAATIGAPNYTEVLNARPLPCKYCPMGCHRDITVEEPKEYAHRGVGPEYETLGMLGSNLLIDDLKAIAKANDMINRLGIDTISTGACIGFAMECCERGWVSKEQTGGLEIMWGDPAVLIELLRQIGNKEGFGAIFSEGALKAAHKIHPDSVERVAHSKGMDFPAHDPRSCFSLATTYAVGTRGACHMRGVSEDVEMGNFYIPEIGVTEKTTEILSDDNQALMALKLQDFCALLNSLCLCAFMIDGGEMSFEEVRNLFNSATGWNCSVDELMRAGTRIVTAQRLINLRDGFDGTTDTLPKAMFEPAREGYRAGKVPDLKRQLKEYYEMRGWDQDGYVPNRVLEELDLPVTPL